MVKQSIVILTADPQSVRHEVNILETAGYGVMTIQGVAEAAEAMDNTTADMFLVDADPCTGALESILRDHDIPVMFLSDHADPEIVENNDRITSYGCVARNSGAPLLLGAVRLTFRVHETYLRLKTRENLLDIAVCSEEKADRAQRVIARTGDALKRSEAFNRRLVESSPIGILVLDGSGLVSYENEALRRMLGVPEGERSPAIGVPITGIQQIEQSCLLAMAQRVMNGETITGAEIQYRSIFGKELDFEINTASITNDSGLPDGAIVMVHDISERRRVKAQTEKHISNMEFLSKSAIGFIDLTPGSDIYEFIAGKLHELFPDFRIIVNEYDEENGMSTIRAIGGVGGIMSSLLKILGKNPVGLQTSISQGAREEMLRQRFVTGPQGTSDLSGGVIPQVMGAALDSLLGIGTIYGMGFTRQNHLLGNVVLISPKGTTIDDPSLAEAFIQQASVALQKHRAERALEKTVQEKEALLMELQHRVKNSLAIIIGLIGLESNRITDVRTLDMLANIRDRVGSIANLYDLLYNSREVREIWLNQYIEHLTRMLMDSYIPDRGRIGLATELEEIRIDVKRALSIGLIINELITNSMKYAFPGEKSGTISIILKRHKGRIVLDLLDDGIGLPAGFIPEKSEGIGITLVNMMVRQLNGEIKSVKGRGARYRVAVPL